MFTGSDRWAAALASALLLMASIACSDSESSGSAAGGNGGAIGGASGKAGNAGSGIGGGAGVGGGAGGQAAGAGAAGTFSCVDVMDHGATGDGVTDDTAGIQKAIDYAFSQGCGTVCVPDGTFLIDPDVSVRLSSNIKLSLAPNATLKAIPTSSEGYAVVDVRDVSNVEVSGGRILGERDAHTGTSGEWGMGINLVGSNNVRIANVSISDCWGDGIYVGVGTQKFCQDVIIEGFTLDNNRRQGISVISAKTLIIRNGVISNTNGTAPQAGIDLEPNHDTEFLLDVAIENVHTEYNAGYGIMCWLGNFAPPPATDQLKVTITNHTDTGSTKGALGNFATYIDQGYDITIN